MKNLMKVETAERITAAGRMFGEIVSLALAAVAIPLGIGLVVWMIYNISARWPYAG